MNNLLSARDQANAYTLWKRGEDTHMISKILRVDESKVYNSISKLKEDLRRNKL